MAIHTVRTREMDPFGDICCSTKGNLKLRASGPHRMFVYKCVVCKKKWFKFGDSGKLTTHLGN